MAERSRSFEIQRGRIATPVGGFAGGAARTRPRKPEPPGTFEFDFFFLHRPVD